MIFRDIISFIPDVRVIPHILYYNADDLVLATNLSDSSSLKSWCLLGSNTIFMLEKREIEYILLWKRRDIAVMLQNLTWIFRLSTNCSHFSAVRSSEGNRFIAAGDYNAKHIHWRSRLILPTGREFFKAIDAMNLITLSTGELNRGLPTEDCLLTIWQ
jgi:hypothetical protein